MKNSIYIYGIINTSESQDFGEIGIGDNAASRVLSVGFKDIAAVISYTHPVVYASLSKEKVIKDLATHQLVIEKVMERFTVLPVKFGTTVKTENEAIEFLENGFSLLSRNLHQMEGKIELDLVACWELPKVLAAISHQNDQIQEKQQEIAKQGEQGRIEDKIMLGQLIEQALKTKKARYQEAILQMLKPETVDICLHDLANDEMVFNAAFLLEKKKEESFNQAVQTLDQQLENALYFRVVGPLPPYSFSTILFERIDPGRIEEAKKTLGLTGEITDKALHDAYYQLAKVYHPDKKSGATSTEFQRIHSAYRVLTNFLEHGLVFAEVYQWKENTHE
jgi:hypothetical protein